MRSLIFYLAIFCLFEEGNGQKIKLTSYLEGLEATSTHEFFFKSEWVDSIYINEPDGDYMNVISQAIQNTGLELHIRNKHYVFIYPNRLEYEKLKLRDQNVLNEEDFDNFIKIGNPSSYDGQRSHTLSGFVLDEQGNGLPGVTVVAEPLKSGSTTSDDGSYSLGLPSGNYTVNYNYVGLQSEKRFVTLYGSGELSISLFPETNLLNEVVVEGQAEVARLDDPMIGKSTISLTAIESMPALLGEVDVLKSITMIPGVNVSGESSSYLNVRGGRNDQTLVLMNSAPIYTPGHVLGFFSVFNGDIVSDFSLYKGNIPSNYGTRASSVLDVKMGRWAKDKVNYYGGIGIVNTNLGVKAKLADDKLDIHLGGRTSYSDWLFNLVPNEDILKSSARFSDGNLIARFSPNQRNTFHISSYYGADFFRYSDKVIYDWDAANGSIEWDHLFNNDWVISTRLIYSYLDNTAEGLVANERYFLENGISTIGLQSEISTDLALGHLDLGTELNAHVINPGKISPLGNFSRIESQEVQKEHLQSLGLFLNHEVKLFNNVILNSGLRHVTFQNIGPTEINIYEQENPFIEEYVVGSKEYESGEVMNTYNALEPRIGLSWTIGNHAVKAGYTRTNQFLHLISNTALINPVSVWKGSDQFIKPTRIDQYSLGYQLNFSSFSNFSVEGYYKSMENLIDFRDGAELVLNQNLEQAIVGGNGTSYGVEFQANKTSGRLKGWLSYTYSRAFIKTNGRFESDVINSGKKYPYYSDRPHNVQMNGNYKITKKWTVSANFIFTSGAPTNAPTNVFEIDDINIPYFQERNSVRIPDYHRLDLAITLKSRIRKTKKNNDRWVFSVYNVYGRSNASTVFFARRDELPARPFKLISIGNAIPTLTYKFEI